MALSQSQTPSVLGALLHGSCKPNQLTHGCCNQNQDFDSTSKDLDNSSKALPYKSYATSTVGEGLVAQPQTAPLCPLDTSPTGRPLPKPFRSTLPKCGADQLLRRVRRLRRTERLVTKLSKCEAHPIFRRNGPQPETAPLCRYATPPLREDHIGHPQNDGCFC